MGAVSERSPLIFEEKLIYFPSREIVATPEALGLLGEEALLRASDGIRIHGWFLPAPLRRSPDFTILLCHGNAGNISGRLDRAALLLGRLGVNVFLFDYRGYGRSEGRPSEEGTYRDAVAAHRYLVEERGVGAKRLILFGESLGAAVAIELARREKAAALVLEAPFTSIADMARVAYPFLGPFASLVRTRYDNLRKIPEVALPLLIFHARRDPVVPFEQGEALFRAAREPKTFVPLENAGHADGFLVAGDVYWNAWKDFLDSAGGKGEG
jgi:fermentation-respiration switch protein FrsA (DUF1100 family)